MSPTPLGPYTPVVAAGPWLIGSGQVGVSDGQMVPGGVAAQTRQAVANLSALLAQHGASLDDVVKTTVFMADLAEFAQMNEEYGKHFSPPFPARSTVQAAALPRGARVEIDAIAVR